MSSRMLLAIALGAVSLAIVPAGAQAACSADGDTRQNPYCYNAPGTVLQDRTGFGTNVGFGVQAGERISCPRADGFFYSWSSTVWYAFHPHLPGRLDVQVTGLDLHLALEEGEGPPGAGRLVKCSDDSGANDVSSERLEVDGLQAGRTYLLQIGEFSRVLLQNGTFELRGTFLPDRDGDGVIDRDDRCPTVAAPGGCPAPPPPAPPPDPDPDRDGIRGAADRCPTVSAGGRDGNQDGCRDRSRVTLDVKWRIVRTRGSGVILRQLRLRGAGPGTSVRVRCSRGCRGAKLAIRRNRTTVSARRLGARRLRPGTTIDVVVTRPGRNGEVHRFKVLRTTMDDLYTRCLPEGTSRPVKGACY